MKLIYSEHLNLDVFLNIPGEFIYKNNENIKSTINNLKILKLDMRNTKPTIYLHLTGSHRKKEVINLQIFFYEFVIQLFTISIIICAIYDNINKI